MQRLSTLETWRSYAKAQRASGRVVGLVPTMGALHAGHASLFDAARTHGDLVLATIFVNPRQFNDANDLRAYPRTPELDQRAALEHGVDCLVEPTLEEMWPDYPNDTPTTVTVRGVGDILEGAGRPGHFDGVASVVAKLFSVTGECRAYFGEKDYQQIAVIRQMVRDLALDVEVVSCPIVRDADGLALSSRNARLSDDARTRATAFSRALQSAQSSSSTASALRALMRETLESAGIEVAYADVVDPVTLVSSKDDEAGERRALLAGVVGGVRLIDNAPVVVRARRG
ncbi:MAG: pantoate--beta-alanine ligase [Acidobacteria bacterium]|nr:pantoate--beta-alanine ligase [Acidobacteriota bacterium]